MENPGQFRVEINTQGLLGMLDQPADAGGRHAEVLGRTVYRAPQHHGADDLQLTERNLFQADLELAAPAQQTGICAAPQADLVGLPPEKWSSLK